MKKLLLAATIAGILGGSTDIHAGDTAKKVWAYYKILTGITHIPWIVGFPALGVATMGTQEGANRFTQVQSLASLSIGPTVILPFSVLCIKSGLRDLRKLKKNDIHIQI